MRTEDGATVGFGGLARSNKCLIIEKARFSIILLSGLCISQVITMTTITSTNLLLLGGLGVILLWGVAFNNGTLENMNAVIAQGFFPDGRQLRSTYTGNVVLDARLTYLVAFYEVLSNDLSDGPRRLFVDLVVLLCCSSVWVFIESRRRGVRRIALRQYVHPSDIALETLLTMDDDINTAPSRSSSCGMPSGPPLSNLSTSTASARATPLRGTQRFP